MKPPLKPGVRRIVWFVGIWAASVAALAVVSYGLKAVLLP